MILKKIKRKIFLFINKFPIGNAFFIYVNLILFHWDEKRHYEKVSKNKYAKTIYVIEPRSTNEGLLSSFYYVMANVKWAKKKGYIPYVDFSNDKCQYHVDRVVNNTTNAWEYYFTQPTVINSNFREELDCNILISGWSFKEKIMTIKKDLNTVATKENKYISNKILSINKVMELEANTIYNNLFINKKTLGVFIRGTDYVSLKPKNHPIQPNIYELIDKVDEFVNKYKIDNIYFVTEDYNYYQIFQKKYADKIITIDNEYIENYEKNKYVYENMTSDPYERGKKYLLRLLMLSQCNYLVSSITNGSLFVKSIQRKEFLDEYWFDIGFYE